MIDTKNIEELEEATKVTFYKIILFKNLNLGKITFYSMIWKVYVVSEVVYAERLLIEVTLFKIFAFLASLSFT